MASLSVSLATQVSQRTTLTAVQRQSVELLQLTGPELQQAVDDALAANPFLEAADDEAAEGQNAPEGDQDAPQGEGLQRAFFDDSVGVAADFERSKEPAVLTWKKTPADYEGEARDPFEHIASVGTLSQHLLEQLACARIDEKSAAHVEWLIGNLNEEGFLAEPLAEIFANCPEPCSLQEAQAALALLQSFDPAGVGASDACEALIIQLRRLEQSKDNPDATPEHCRLAARLLHECPAEIMKRDFKKAAKTLEASVGDVETAFALIGTLNPHPAADFADMRSLSFVVPEIVLVREKDNWIAKLNTAVVPRLGFDFENFELLTQAKLAKDEQTSWNQKAVQAKQFLHALEYRFSTITAVAQTIVDMQRSFFTKGPSALKPLFLKDVANRLGMSESTVSRATAGKFMQTPLGTFELKHFFGAGFSASDGEAVSTAAVRRRIVEIIASENPAKPLSDGAIAEMLASEGIIVARRTVAKYRELEHIAARSLRKAARSQI